MNDFSDIKIGNSTIMFGGGKRLEGCPTSSKEAHKITDKFNKKKEEDWYEPNWSWDCGFKLDFDGALLRVSSRFYPPAERYGKTWDGSVTIMIKDRKIETKKFDCKTLPELRKEVEKYIKDFEKRLIKKLTE